MTGYNQHIVTGHKLLTQAEISVAKVSAGGDHSLFLTPTGDVWSCGANASGTLGRPTYNALQQDYLGKINGLPNIIDIVAGNDHSLFLDSNRNVWSCGNNNWGQLARTTSENTTYQVGQTPLTGIISMAAGKQHSLFVDSAGYAYSCGWNNYQQLGRDVESGYHDQSNLGEIPDLADENSAVAAGDYHSLFLQHGAVYSCGWNNYGQLGRKTDYAADSIKLIILGDPDDPISVSALSAMAAGEFHTILLSMSGFVISCGANHSGQLGVTGASGSYYAEDNLRQISSFDLSDIIAIDAGNDFSLFLGLNHKVYACGANQWGQLGKYTNSLAINIPELIPALTGIVSISANVSHSLFADSNGDAWSCGNNDHLAVGRHVASGSNTSPNLGKITS